VSDLVLDASLALQWFLEDETGRQCSTASASSQAFPPNVQRFRSCGSMKWATAFSWLTGGKRITLDQIDGFLTRLKALPIDAAQQVPTEVLELPAIAQKHSLTNYDAAYLALAMHLRLPLATTDADLRRAAATSGVQLVLE
jgi:predicted nucleic acid-binding protein